VIADKGIITAGAVNVVHGARRAGRTAVYPADSGSTALVVEDLKTLRLARKRCSSFGLHSTLYRLICFALG